MGQAFAIWAKAQRAAQDGLIRCPSLAIDDDDLFLLGASAVGEALTIRADSEEFGDQAREIYLRQALFRDAALQGGAATTRRCGTTEQCAKHRETSSERAHASILSLCEVGSETVVPRWGQGLRSRSASRTRAPLARSCQDVQGRCACPGRQRRAPLRQSWGCAGWYRSRAP